MWCPTCQKEVEVSEGDPSASRLQVKKGLLTVDMEVTDLCEEDNTILRHAKTTVERDLRGIDKLKSHLGESHEWKVEVQKTERIAGLPGYIGIRLHFIVNCSCGAEPYIGVVGKSIALVEK